MLAGRRLVLGALVIGVSSAFGCAACFAEPAVSDRKVTAKAPTNGFDKARSNGSAKFTAASKRGQALYAAYQCNACHVLNGKGPTDGVPLDSVGLARSAKFIKDHLRNPEDHVAKNPAAFKGDPNLMPEHGFSEGELTDLTAYLQTLRKAQVKDPGATPQK